VDHFSQCIATWIHTLAHAANKNGIALPENIQKLLQSRLNDVSFIQAVESRLEVVESEPDKRVNQNAILKMIA
jgi:hypothetical protein